MAKKRGGRSISKKKRRTSRKKPKISKKDIVRHISHKYRKRFKVFEYHKPHRHYRIPPGIKVLVAYLSVLLLFNLIYFFLGLEAPIAFFAGQIIQGGWAVFITLASIAILGFIIYGFNRRKKWSYHLSLLWFAVAIIDSLVSLFALNTEVAATKNLVVLSSVTVLVINLLAAWYVVSEKKYFFAKEFLQRRAAIIDKVFVFLVAAFLVFVLLIGVFVGYDFYAENKYYADNLIEELDGKTGAQQMDICNGKEGAEKDLCLTIASVKQDRPDLCYQIQSDFYRITCLRA